MASPAYQSKHRTRELRRRLVARARVRSDQQWGDACILNVSSRGMLIQSARPIAEGSIVEVLRGDQLIIARVMWSEAGRSGIRSDERLPVEDILSLEQSHSLQLIASNGVLHDRRGGTRAVASEARVHGRAIEFLAVGTVAILLAFGLWVMAEAALSGPLARVSAVLGG
jgi:hypothetical protein